MSGFTARAAAIVQMRATDMPLHLPDVEKTTVYRILSYVVPYRARAAAVLGCITAAAVLNLALPWFAKQIVDVAIPRGDMALLWLYCGGMVAGPVAAGLLQVAQKYG